MMTAHRCEAPGCGRFVRAGAAHCNKHASPDSAHQETEDQAEAQVRFRELLKQGNYEALFDDDFTKMMQQAAKSLAERGLIEEIGALRMVLSRLVKEEQDLSKLTANVTRLANVAVRVARAQRAIGGEEAQGLMSAMTQILAELDEG